MNWTETETVISICTGIVTCTQFFLWRYIARNKSYESEKGKNLATKEDIGEITQKMGEIKDIFDKDLAKFNANLALQNNLQTGFYTEERNAILEFNKSLFIWQHSTVSLNIKDYSDNRELQDYIMTVNRYFEDTYHNLTLFKFFIKDEKLIEKADELIIKTLELNKSIPLCVLDLSKVNEELYALDKSDSDYKRKRQEKLSLDSKIILDFYNTQTNIYSMIKKNNVDFQRFCREYLYNRLTKIP